MIAAGLALLILTSCSDPANEAADQMEQALEAQLGEGATAQVDPDTEAISVETEDGFFAKGVDLAAPEWLDPAVTLPDDLKITTILVADSIQSFRGSSEADADSLAARTESALAEAGWTIDSATVGDDSTFLLESTDLQGVFVDIELTGGEYIFVRGRLRPGS